MSEEPGPVEEKESEYGRRLLAAAGGLSLIGVATGPAGLGFLTEPVPTPLWFLLTAFVLPTGETLALFRSVVRYKRLDK
jgi:hypothetical protein